MRPAKGNPRVGGEKSKDEGEGVQRSARVKVLNLERAIAVRGREEKAEEKLEVVRCEVACPQRLGMFWTSSALLWYQVTSVSIRSQLPSIAQQCWLGCSSCSGGLLWGFQRGR